MFLFGKAKKKVQNKRYPNYNIFTIHINIIKKVSLESLKIDYTFLAVKINYVKIISFNVTLPFRSWYYILDVTWKFVWNSLSLCRRLEVSLEWTSTIPIKIKLWACLHSKYTRSSNQNAYAKVVSVNKVLTSNKSQPKNNNKVKGACGCRVFGLIKFDTTNKKLQVMIAYH